MTERIKEEQIDLWRKEGAVVVPEFFESEEIDAVVKDFQVIFPDRQAASLPIDNKEKGDVGKTTLEQFKNFENIPFDCSSSLNLISVHPDLIEFARQALKTNDVRLYQAQAWAKFTGEADFDQAFHCDFGNHTLTVPSRDECLNSITFIIYFSDVTEAHGPTHYVNRTDSDNCGGMNRFLNKREDLEFQKELIKFERSAAGPAGTLLAYGIDVFHRGTNLTEPNGYRYAMTSCFKKAGNDAIGYTAWPWHFNKPWHKIFEHATPEQLSCFGVPLPGDPFWTEETMTLAKLRYPRWDMSEYTSKQ